MNATSMAIIPAVTAAVTRGGSSDLLCYLDDFIPGDPLLFIESGMVDSIGLLVEDYDLIGPTLQPVFFSDSDTPIIFDNYAALWVAVAAVPTLNEGNLIGVEGKWVLVYDIDTSRTTLNKALVASGLPAVPGANYWTDEHILDDAAVL